MSREKAEQACVEAGKCSVDQFRYRSEKCLWRINCYKDCYPVILKACAIEDDVKKNNQRKLIVFLNAKDDDGASIGVKRSREAAFNGSYVELDEDMDVSFKSVDSSVMYLDEPPEVIELKRALTGAQMEINALQEDKTQLELALAESKKQVTCVQAELEKEKERTKERKFWGKEKVARHRRGSGMQWRSEMRDASLKSLAVGIQATTVEKVLKNVAHGLGVSPDDVPKVATINKWRDVDLVCLNQNQLRQFLERSSRLTLCLDDASFKDHKVRIL